MISPAYCRLMAHYNRWMNERIYAVCAGIPDGERKAGRGAFFGSVHDTLNHLIFGDRAWLGRFSDGRFEVPPVGQRIHEDFEALREDRTAMDAEILAWAESVTDEWLASSMTWTSAIYEATETQPAWALVTHMFNHQTHHRGQVTTLLSQMGHDPGITDLPRLPWLLEGGLGRTGN